MGGLGNGQQASNVLHAKYHNNSKEARRARYEKLVNFDWSKDRIQTTIPADYCEGDFMK